MYARVGDPLLERGSERVSEAAYGVLTLRETSLARERRILTARVKAARRDQVSTRPSSTRITWIVVGEVGHCLGLLFYYMKGSIFTFCDFLSQ
jgi:hypothetical protein